MLRSFRVDPRDAVPIWKQIEHGVRHLVASGALPAGGPVPSVRDLSRHLRINPATVAKAYQRLADAGVLVVHRGEGTFVADAPPHLPRAERRRVLREGAERYASLVRTVGVPAEDAIEELRDVLAELVSGAERSIAR